MDWITLINDWLIWIFPFFKNQETIPPAYAILTSLLFGLFFLNYKYIIHTFNKSYEELNVFTKLCLAFIFGFSLFLFAYINFLLITAILKPLTGLYWPPISFWMIYFLFSIIYGFYGFIPLSNKDIKNPFRDINGFVRFSIFFLFFLFSLSWLVSFGDSLFFKELISKNVFNIKGFLIWLLFFYLVLKFIEGINQDTKETLGREILFNNQIKWIINKIEYIFKILRWIYRIFKFILKKIKLKK